MANEHNINTFTAADIAKYHAGQMSAKERHAIEKAALDDPFLADALEGYAIPSVNSNTDISELKKRLATRIEQHKERPLAPVLRSSFYWWKVAAMIILIFGAGLLVYQFGFNNKRAEIAETNKKVPNNQDTNKQIFTNPDSVPSFNPDSLSKDVAMQLPQKDLSYKKTDQSSVLVSPGLKTENIPAESIAVQDDFAKRLIDTTISGTTTAQARKDHTANKIKKSVRNDTAFDERGIVEKNYDFKNKELSVRKKPDANAIPGRFDGNVAAAPAAGNAISKQQGFYQNNQNNVFRGRVTDANNNALPFSNITNLQDNAGTYSDARGYFNLTSPDSVLNVQVRSLGFESKNVQLQNKLPENKISMEEDRSLSATVLDTVKRNTNRFRNTNMVLEEPEPLDGWSNYDIYLVNNLKVPESFRSKQSGSREVELSFEVDKNGEPINITVKKSLCERCDKEAIRLIKQGPKWKRKINKGKAIVTVVF